MDEFRIMFPGLATELIESVLRSNKGAVDETIDQLLSMNIVKPDDNVAKSADLTPVMIQIIYLIRDDGNMFLIWY